MRILVTGGAGYVGSACLRWLLRHGHEPVAYDNLSQGNRAAVAGAHLVAADLADRDAVVRAMQEHRIDAVMHFAAVASVPDSIADPETYYRVNVIGTKNVLDAMVVCGVKKLIFSSTAATYAFTDDMPLTEDSPQRPQVPYGTTKLAAEWMIKDYHRAYGIAYTIFRYFNASGADPDGRYGESRRNESHLIPLALAVATGQREKLQIFGRDFPTRDGSCVRDFVHTDDLAQAHQRALETMTPDSGLIYNVGCGAGVSVLEVLRACEAVVGRPIRHEIVARRPGDPGVLVASDRKLREELGWKPRFGDIRDIVATAWRWHESHPRGYAEQTADAARGAT